MIYSLGGERTVTWPGMSYYAALLISLVLCLGCGGSYVRPPKDERCDHDHSLRVIR